MRGIGVSTSTPTTGQAMIYDGAQWTPAPVSVAAGNVTGLAASVDSRILLQAGAANGLATLDSLGKLPSSQVPALAINNTSVVNSQAAQLAL